MDRLKKIPKIYYFGLLLLLVVLAIVAIPTLARYKNRLSIDVSTVWDGSIAKSYRKGTGTKDDPYIISNGSELAYFASMLKTNSYANTYFKLNNNIVLNDGVFSYDDTSKIMYTLNDSTFYVKNYTNYFYDNVNYRGTRIGTLNSFSSLDKFKGDFDGNSYTIYGLYMTNKTASDIALFTNLEGNVHDLYLKNTMLYGGSTTTIISSSNNSNIENIMSEGYIIGNDTKYSNLSVSIDNLVSNEGTKKININYDAPKNVITTKVSGTCSSSCEFTINGNSVSAINGFSLDLGSTLVTELTFDFVTTTYNISNLKYEISYNNQMSSGIVGKAVNTNIKNVINKSYVYSGLNSSGIVGSMDFSSSLINSYNVGTINGINSSGLVSSISDNTSNVIVSNSYNIGTLTGTKVNGLIYEVYNSNGIIKNSFNASNSSYLINTISNSTITADGVYYTSGSVISSGTISGNVTNIALSSLKNKTFLTDTLLFKEFVDSNDMVSNPSNIWIYEEDNFPVLFIDDIVNPIATLHVGTYSWNNVGYVPDKINFSSAITFSIESEDNLRPIKEYYYYIGSDTPLRKGEIETISDWKQYDSVLKITEEGKYIIYAKVVDYNDNVTYLNSEILILDMSDPTVSISYNKNKWTNLNEVPGYVYINKESVFKIDGVDDLSGISGVKYYISDVILTSDEVKNLDDSSWINYDNGVSVDVKGNYIIYARVVDNTNHISYANSDIISYGGYEIKNVYVGKNLSDLVNINITDKSSISLNFVYVDTNGYKPGYTHNIVSNYVLPKGSRLTILDNKNNKRYVYEITTDDDFGYSSKGKAIYPFTLFKEVGKSTNNNFFKELENGNIDENFTVTLDLLKTNITLEYTNLNLFLELIDSNEETSRPTIDSTLKNINIYVNKDATASISSTYGGNIIAYDSDSTSNIPLIVKLNYGYVNNMLVNDTVVEDKKLGISIKVVDKDNGIIEQKYLKNIKYKIGDTLYSIENDGIARINLNNLDTFTGNLVISTVLDNSELLNGEYYFKINSYVSYDGLYDTNVSSETITIPMTNNSTRYSYSFDILSDDTYKTILKKDSNTTVKFNILQNGGFINPNIRVSLYKKNKLTAFDQTYTIVDLKDYVTNSLEKVSDNIYYAIKSPLFYNGQASTYNAFNLNFINTNFENNGYKLVFELYSGSVKIATIEKKFIVK